jgi:hypothetical protein
MSTTTQYNALIEKVRSWSNKPEGATLSDTVIESCLAYGADDCYSQLRIPPLETSVEYTVDTADNVGDGSYSNSMYNSAYTSFAIPGDLTEFVFLRTKVNSSNIVSSNRVFNEITDRRAFFDIFAETYSAYNWMWSEGKIFVRPQLPVGTVLQIGYYRRLPALNALYSVIPANYDVTLADANQPYLAVGTSADTALYVSTSGGVTKAFLTSAEAAAYNASVTTKYFTGKEVSNWLKDSNEQLLLWSALSHLGGFLMDDVMEKRFMMKASNKIELLNREEKLRRARGGNVHIGFNANGLI